MIRKQDALDYHSQGRKGKIEVVSTKPCYTQLDLSLAYTPGVADPCLEIDKKPSDAFKYTAKGNLVAVVSNGTAVLGLGNIGPLASKPVMEGKGVLFKRFADIDVFDIEIDAKDPKEIIKIVKALEPTFGGINLEDIKAPDCFAIEETLIEQMDIPVFHDDQHGTAIIGGAGLINALELVDKKIEEVKVVFNGAGASAVAIANFFIDLGVKLKNILMVDSKGVIYQGRTAGMNPYKEKFAAKTNRRSLAEAMEDADVFIGVSVANCVDQKMIKSMAKKPIVFAMANPDSEIAYDQAKAAREDVIMATGRSDFPNQINNVLGFPFIFRGALDVQARKINKEMKLAAAKALAALAKEEVPEAVCRAYGVDKLSFGAEYIIPKPLDPRVLLWVAPAIAEAAIKSGVARKELPDIEAYREQLETLVNPSSRVTHSIIHKAQKNQRKIVFPEGEETKILKAAQSMVTQKICKPILLGHRDIILKKMKELEFEANENKIEIIDTFDNKFHNSYVQQLYQLRRRKGLTMAEAERRIKNVNVFGSMMVHSGDADGMVSGLTSYYPETLRPVLQLVGIKEGVNKVSGLYMLILKRQLFFFADTTVNPNPTAEELAEIAIGAAETAKHLDIEPRVAMLSFSNFGSAEHPYVDKVRQATSIAKKRCPNIEIDGEMQADTAVNRELMQAFPFCELKGEANVLVFPNLAAGNIAYKLMVQLGGALPIGPLLVGMSKPVNVLQRGASVNDIINVAAITVVEANGEKG